MEKGDRVRFLPTLKTGVVKLFLALDNGEAVALVVWDDGRGESLVRQRELALAPIFDDFERLTPFDEADWAAFSGATRHPAYGEPLIGRLVVPDLGEGRAICDATGLHLYFDDGTQLRLNTGQFYANAALADWLCRHEEVTRDELVKLFGFLVTQKGFGQ